MEKKVNEKVNADCICIFCEKHYSSNSSLCNHKRVFHKNELHQTPQNSTKTPPNSTPTIFETLHPEYSAPLLTLASGVGKVSSDKSFKLVCEHCHQQFSRTDSKRRHERTCQKKQQNDQEFILKLKQQELELKKEEATILRLKLKLQNSHKVDTITLKKLNKMLLARQNRIQNATITYNTNIQNNIIHQYQIVGFGRENEIQHVLTHQEKKQIVNAKFNSLDKLIEIVHCGKYNQFKNIIITNIKDNYMYKYDENKGVFVLSPKMEVLKSLIDYRMGDLEIIYHELLEKNKVDERTKNCIERFINQINYDDSKYVDMKGQEHDNCKEYKINEIKMLLYNNQEKITNDICLLLSTEEIPMIGSLGIL